MVVKLLKSHLPQQKIMWITIQSISAHVTEIFSIFLTNLETDIKNL